ncbi:unnamed protein product [Malus baccata var. baccata]
MGDSLGSSHVSSQKQNRKGVVSAQSGQYHVTAKSSPGCGGVRVGITRHFGSSLASNSRKRNPRMGDSLGSSHVSSQKQNRKGVVRAQSEQYHVTAKSSPGCDGVRFGM